MTLLFKYIIVNSGAILFNEMTTHSQVAEGFIKQKQKIYSAGFVKLEFNGGTYVDKIECFGTSASLDIKSHPKEDEEVILDLFKEISEFKYFAKQAADLYQS